MNFVELQTGQQRQNEKQRKQTEEAAESGRLLLHMNYAHCNTQNAFQVSIAEIRTSALKPLRR